VAYQKQKGRGGRPEKPKRERRVHRLTVRLTDSELAAFERRAEEASLSMSELIRRKVLGKPTSAKANAALRVRLRELVMELERLRKQATGEGEDPAEGNPDEGDATERSPAGGSLTEEALIIVLDEARAVLSQCTAQQRGPGVL
jgi:hypothetical protein